MSHTWKYGEFVERVECRMGHMPIYTHSPRLVVSLSTCLSSTIPVPPREQLCNRYCSNKHSLTHKHTHTHTHPPPHPHPHTHSHTHRYGTYGTVTCPPVKKKERKKEQDTEARYPQPTRKIDTQFGIPRDGDRLFILIFLHSIWHSGLKCLRRRPFFSSSRHILKSPLIQGKY